MPEPKYNPNPKFMVDPPALLRHAIRKFVFEPVIHPDRLRKKRDRIETMRTRNGSAHIVEYYHQLDDPYSHLASQVIAKLVERYDIELVPHLIQASGGKNQPEEAKLAKLAHKEAITIAPYLGLEFPRNSPITPNYDQISFACQLLSEMQNAEFVQQLPILNDAMWRGKLLPSGIKTVDQMETVKILETGSARLAKLGHYSGAMFHYGGEWYWGVDRLFHLERRLRELGACFDPSLPLICPRPAIDVWGVDASMLELDFYPSLNSPYTSIIYDKTLQVARESKVKFNHKPVLPMIMRGVPATREKGSYIAYDTNREAIDLGVPFGPVMMPIGEPVRQVYSLFPWARENGKETDLLSAALHLAFGRGVGLHNKKGLRAAVEMAGLSWAEAQAHLGGDAWKKDIQSNQDELDRELDLWGVPSYRLRGGGEPDLCVWGQDRLWLIAAEMRRRSGWVSEC